MACAAGVTPIAFRSTAAPLSAILGLAWFASAQSSLAELRPHALFSHGAVLQQGKALPIWGWADPGSTITVSFRGRTLSATTSPAGKWSVSLPSQKPGGPDELVLGDGSQTLTLTNILVGEVWVCSGQSNMEWPMTRSESPQVAIETSAHDRIRLFTVPKLKAAEPIDEVRAQWELCGPESVARFSAVAYYFGRDLQAARGVPVGLVHTSWGGSPAEVWIREEVMAANPEFKRDILDPYPERKRAFDKALADWERETAELRAQGKEQTRGRPWADWRPAELFNGMIHPLLPYPIAGAIWYQGESNAGRADQYARLFPTLIQNWRAEWNQGDFPFLAVQLAPWDKNRKRSLSEITAQPGESDWAELRESQWIATRVLPKVGMAVITDVGDKDDIHPVKKEPVGARLALLARCVAYRERIPCSGPMFKSMSVSRGRATISFDHTHGGLIARGGPLSGFQICGTNREWVWADAEIRGRRVVVSNPSVPEPIAVRYGWADFPVVNLFNKAGLPASPFRTDNFPLTTAVKAP